METVLAAVAGAIVSGVSTLVWRSRRSQTSLDRAHAALADAQAGESEATEASVLTGAALDLVRQLQADRDVMREQIRGLQREVHVLKERFRLEADYRRTLQTELLQHGIQPPARPEKGE